ncbi:LuxR C-terminal-related transcriptional regulator [Kitasatospora sp. NPDC058170]|uniref:LuxR C-terminal-related transcriptional regulator n=1 Tax=Kitasatospora sp. NPDC058170 TaxID=3346364 RepID=UPI0036DC9703
MSALGALGQLSADQAAVLDRVGAGMTNSEIAVALSLGLQAVRRLIAQSLVRLDAEDRMSAFVRAWQSGQIPHARPVGRAPALSGEQTRVLLIWAAGGSQSHVARALHISERTVSRWEQSILTALGARNRAVAVRSALEHRLIDPGRESLAALCTEPMAADSGQGRTRQFPDEETNDAEIGTTPPAAHPVEEVLHSAAGVIVHLGALAGLPLAPSLPQILLGAPPRDRTPAVVRLLHRALALGRPCALVIPPGAGNAVRVASAAGLDCAWSGAVRQSVANPAAAYAAAAHQLGAAPDRCVVLCPGDQAPAAASVGPMQVLTTATAARTVARRSPLPAVSSRDRQIAELTARGYPTARIGEQLAVGEHLVHSELAAMRERFAAADDTELVARLITAELIDTRHLRAELPAHAPDLDQVERAVLALMCAGGPTPDGVRAAGLTWREARAAETRAVQTLSPRRSRTHAVAVALVTGVVAPPIPPPTSLPEPSVPRAAPRRRPRTSPSRTGGVRPGRLAAEGEHAPAGR